MSADKQQLSPDHGPYGPPELMDIQAVRSRLVDGAMMVLAILALPVSALSLARFLETGWNHIFYLHLAVVGLVGSIAINRKRLAYWLRASVLLSVFLVLGVVGLVMYGLPGGGMMLLFTFCMLTTVFFGRRAGLTAYVISVGVIVAVAAAIFTGVISFSVNMGLYANSVTAWTSILGAFVVFVLIIVVGLGGLHDHLASSLLALEKSEARHRRIMDNLVRSFIYQHDTVGKFNYLSRSITNVLGYEPDEFLKDINTYLTDHPVNDEVRRHTELSIQGVQQPPYEVQIRHKNSEIYWLEVSETPMRDDSGQVIGVEGIAHDITARKRLEGQLRQSQKMEAVGQLAGGVAHDFNNLLQVILGFGELALAESEPGGTVYDGVDQMLSAGKRAAALVRQLLAFSRQQVLRLEDLDIREIVTDLAKMIRRVIGEDIVLDIRCQTGLPAIRADRGQIEQILLNLCINARDAMSGGGSLILETDCVDLDDEYCRPFPWASPGRYAMLSVTDTGCGMDPEVQQRIFEPFFTTKGLDKGTGLGLSTVYGIVQQHNGITSVSSAVGAGTTFQIYFPLLSESSTPGDAAPAAEPPGGTETILIAEDDDSVRAVAERFLSAQGYTVLTAEDGSEAIRLFDENIDRIDFVLLDVVMPKLGGRAVFDHIRAKSPQTGILFASGYNSSGIHVDSVLADDMELIQKPYRRHELLLTVRRMLDQQS
jgi:PAS domain S-box-containing protein